MKEVSIIINDIRYDAVPNILPCDCYGCDLADYCLNMNHTIMACSELIGNNRFFKKRTE